MVVIVNVNLLPLIPRWWFVARNQHRYCKNWYALSYHCSHQLREVSFTSELGCWVVNQEGSGASGKSFVIQIVG